MLEEEDKRNDGETDGEFEKEQDQHEDGDGNGNGKHRCPNTNCDFTFNWKDGNDKHFVCESCSESFCLKCAYMKGVGPAHPSLTCDERWDQLEDDEEQDERDKLIKWEDANTRADERFNDRCEI